MCYTPATMSGSLLQTKFYIPPERPNLISRPRLLDKLNAGLGDGRLFSRRLTLVSAPAGFGKTTLITNWIHHQERPELTFGWLSLDENDNNLVGFLIYLVSAVQKVANDQEGDFGEELLAGLDSVRPPDEGALLPALLNELAALPRPLMLVLDDYHVIVEESIHTFVAQLIDYLPPQVQVVITSREDPPLPLPRWRVRGQLTEVRAADLRFLPEEAADFLLHTMGLTLDNAAVSALENRTEGWVAGLQLAALAIQSPQRQQTGKADAAQLVADFSGSSRHVASYLLEEVLHRQPEGWQRFLLETAVLERFNAGVCDHLTGRSDSRDMLETLEQNNLFIIPLDNTGDWFRYHHLFAQLLRHRLKRDETAEQWAARHRKARDWFQEQGLMEEAIHHAFKAGDEAWVADYLSRIEPTRLWEGRMAAQFKDWSSQLPSELVDTMPQLLMMTAWSSMITADIKTAEYIIWKLVEFPDLDDTIQAQLLLIKAIFARNEGDSQLALDLVSKALTILPEEQEAIRTIAYMQVVSASFNLGLLDKGHDVSRFVYDSADTQTAAGLVLYINAAQILSIAMRAKLQFYEAMNMLLHTLTVVEERANVPLTMVGVIYAELGRIHYEWNQLDEAADYCQKTIELGKRTGVSDLLFPGYLLDAQLARREGDLKRLGERVAWFKEITRRSELTEMVGIADFIEAAFRLDVGDVESAVRWANASGLSLKDEPIYQRYGHYQTLLRIFMAEAVRTEPYQAEVLAEVSGMIEKLSAVVSQANDIYSIIDLGCLKAIALEMQGQSEAAVAAMTEAVKSAETGTLLRLFLDNGPAVHPLIREVALQHAGSPYVQRLLQACEAEWGAYRADQPVQMSQPLVDPLTDREREVLTCIAAGLSNREIEERLVISRNTVRTHIKNLYSKLGVNGRDEAVEQGRLLGLV